MTTLSNLKFPAATSVDWAKMAEHELNGADPFATLTQSVGGISVKPYYDAKDVSQVETKNNSFISEPWLNIPKVSVQDGKAANVLALEYLNSGADGILFDLKKPVAAEDLLTKIELEHCHVFFRCDGETGSFFLDSFKKLVSKRGWKNLNGSFYWKNGLPAPVSVIENFCCGFEIEGNENSAEQISSALRLAVLQIDTLTNSGVPATAAMKSISFLWPVKNNIFLSVAEMRAMRMLWLLVCEAYNVNTLPLFLHAFSAAWAKESFQPHGNLIKQTTSGLVAVLGNCNALTCEAENEDVSMLTRTSRNISSILKEESYLVKTADPAAGAYFIEHVSCTLAEKAWKIFQQTV